jgi:glutathione synthase/RimK-type ligase-like ATP-grasp enzyme
VGGAGSVGKASGFLFFLDQHRVLETGIDLTVGESVDGFLRLSGSVVPLAEVTGAYVRPYDVRQLPSVRRVGPGTDAWQNALSLDDTIQAWTEVTPALVVNRPSSMASNGSKPYQSILIHAAGFNVPDTLVSTDVAAVLAFRDEHDAVIYKSTSGVRSVVSRLGPEHSVRLSDVGNCPTQFQQYIDGTDYRVHVVGGEVYASEIRTEADDYRYAGRQGHEIEIRACTLDQELADRCRRLAASLGLTVAGIDLRRTSAGEWYCFEVNPSPGFSYYQDATGQPIAAAIASSLVHTDQPSTP